MGGGDTTFHPARRRRGRQSSVALNFLAAVGMGGSSSNRNTNNFGNQQQQQQPYRHNNNTASAARATTASSTSNTAPASTSNATTTPTKVISVATNSSNNHTGTPDTAATTNSASPSSTSMYSPSLWHGSRAQRSSSTRSQQSGKTEPTLDTMESSSGRDSFGSWLPSAQPLRRTANLNNNNNNQTQKQQQKLQAQQTKKSPRTNHHLTTNSNNSHCTRTTTIYERPDRNTGSSSISPDRYLQNLRQQHQQNLMQQYQQSQPIPQQQQQHQQPLHPLSMPLPDTPVTPEQVRSRLAPRMFPATSPAATTRSGGEQSSSQSSLTVSTPRTNSATFDEIRPTESYLANNNNQHHQQSQQLHQLPQIPPQGTNASSNGLSPRTAYSNNNHSNSNDPNYLTIQAHHKDSEQRTTTSSLTSHSTSHHHRHQQQRTANGEGALEAHVLSRPEPQRNATEDWESVSTNEVGHMQQPKGGLDVSGMTLGESIDEGIGMILGGSWVQCTTPTRPKGQSPRTNVSTPTTRTTAVSTPTSSRSPVAKSTGSRSPDFRRAHSIVSGASTEVATNRAVDLALKRVQEIEQSRGAEQALKEARDALERMKAGLSTPLSWENPATPSSDVLERYGAPLLPQVEAQSILSSSTEGSNGEGRTKSTSSMKMVPVGRLDQKVHRMAQQQHMQVQRRDTQGDGNNSLPNESLPSSIGVEVDSKGVAKSNPALRAVFEKHTLDSLHRQRADHHQQVMENPSRIDEDAAYLEQDLSGAYPAQPSSAMHTNGSHYEVRNYSMKNGRSAVIRSATGPPSRTAEPMNRNTFQETPPDPIVCHGTYVSHGTNDMSSFGAPPTVVHPPHLMMATSHDDSTLSSHTGYMQKHSPPQKSMKTIHLDNTATEDILSPLSTHLTSPAEEDPDKQRPGSRLARASRLKRRWPPAGHQPVRPTASGQKETSAIIHGGHAVVAQDNLTPPASVANQNRSNYQSSPALEVKEKLQEANGQCKGLPSPRTSPGQRISSLREQLFARQNEKSLDSFVIRKSSKEPLEAPAIDDTSIDMQSVRSAFDSMHGSTGRMPADEENDSDDDTASVKSLREKYEGSTSSDPKKESEVSKVRAMFESKKKNKPQSKPFERGTGELQEVFAKFQRQDKPVSRARILRQGSFENGKGRPPMNAGTGKKEKENAVNRLLSDVERDCEDDSDAFPVLPKPKRASAIADRIKAFEGSSSKAPAAATRNNGVRSQLPVDNSGPIGVKEAHHSEPQMAALPHSSPSTYAVAAALRSFANRNNPSPQETFPELSGSKLGVPPNTEAPKLRASSTSGDAAGASRLGVEYDGLLMSLENESKLRAHSPVNSIEDTRELFRPTTPGPSTNGNPNRVVDKWGHGKPRSSPTTLAESRKFLRASPVPNTESRAYSGESDGIDVLANDSRPRTPAPRSSPTTIEEARRALRASPKPEKQRVLYSLPQVQVEAMDESQIEEEVAQITATGVSTENTAPPGAVERKFDWFQRAAGMDQGETPVHDSTPLTPTRVQDRVRMFATANAAIDGVRRPVPTPALFNEKLRELARERPMTPERQRFTFRDLRTDTTKTAATTAFGEHGTMQTDLRGPDGSNQVSNDTSYQQSDPGLVGLDLLGAEDDENWFRPQPRRLEPNSASFPARGLVRDYGPGHGTMGIAPRPPVMPTSEYGNHTSALEYKVQGGQNHSDRQSRLPVSQSTREHLSRELFTENNGDFTFRYNSRGELGYEGQQSRTPERASIQEETVQSTTVDASSAKRSASPNEGRNSPSASGSDFSDGVTLDMSIAEVSGLTLPTALISRLGGETSVATVEEEADSEQSSKVNAEVEAKRSEASSSQTSEALIPLLNRTFRQRPMSDEPSTGDSFFEARAIVANHWSKTSDMDQQRSVTKEKLKSRATTDETPQRSRHEETRMTRDDSSGGWDAARVETSFPVKPSNAGDMFEFESGWQPFSAGTSDDDLFKPREEEKKIDDLASRSTTPTRSNRGRILTGFSRGRYLPPIAPVPLSASDKSVGTDHSYDPPPIAQGPLVMAPGHAEMPDNDIPAISSSFDGGSGDDSPDIAAISSFESIERLSRSRLAHHASSRVSSGSGSQQPPNPVLYDPPRIHNTQRGADGRPIPIFGRTHPSSSDPTWEKETYPKYDPTLPANALPNDAQGPKRPNWKPPTGAPGQANPMTDAMQRYGAQHAALVARLKALKEARMQRATAIYARTTSVFPRRVEIDEHSLSTKSSTQFGGSHFMESLKCD